MSNYIFKTSLFLLFFMATTSYADGYCNTRFDYCVNYPKTLIKQPESDNRSGTGFKLKGSSASIMVYGGYNVGADDNLTAKPYLNMLQRQSHSNYQVTYELLKDNDYTVSGYDKQGNIFYRHTKANDDRNTTVHFIYPKSDKSKMDGIIKQMKSSLTLK
ncbi:hypothetical protein [Wielerella bovis]|uniref:hypothetical protein n=1 Tax=Wielerella bovis TaxID=2917790 RepID=UPI002019726C|nr:hypothetical protein [Wielerella bovis]MCG7657995.1 hypothetical protein [Wielerella bovis]MCG7660217.1 hypothetical protein [Wielerella bovis]